MLLFFGKNLLSLHTQLKNVQHEQFFFTPTTHRYYYSFTKTVRVSLACK